MSDSDAQVLEKKDISPNSSSAKNKSIGNFSTFKFKFKEIIIKQYHPIWNVAFMSTGICACVLFNFSYSAHWLRYLGLIMWAVSLLLFIMINLFAFLKIIWFKNTAHQFLFSPTLNVFWGPYSMGFSTIVNMLHLLNDYYDLNFKIGVLIFWWINALIAIVISWSIVFIYFTKENHNEYIKASPFELHTINAVIILPVLPMTVMASAGALVASGLNDDSDRNLKLTLIIISFLSWSYSVFVGFCFTVIFIIRLMISKLPNKQMIFSLFVPIGLLGHASWGIILNGSNLTEYYSLNNDVLKIICLLVGLFFISLGFFFTFLSFMSLIKLGYIKFNKTYWTMPFPLGALALALNEVYLANGSQFTVFRVLSAMYGALAVLLSVFCLIGSFIYEVPWEDLNKKVTLESVGTV